MSELHPPAGFLGYLDCLLQGKPVVLCVLYHPFHVPAAHQFSDHVGLVLFLAQVKDRNDMGMRAQAPHSLGLTSDTGAGGLVQALGLDQGEGHFPVERSVVGKVDHFVAAIPQEPPDLVTAIGEGGGFGGLGDSSCRGDILDIGRDGILTQRPLSGG